MAQTTGMATGGPSTNSAVSTPDFCIAIDVTNLDASGAFFARFGFAVVHVSRQGMLLEERHLQSSEHCGVRIIIRRALGKRPIGTQPGTLLRIALRVPNLKEAVQHLAPGIQWVGAAPNPESLGPQVRFTDPDGYVIELYETTPGVGF